MKKRNLLLLIIAFASLSGSAQSDKPFKAGSLLFSGSVNFNRDRVKVSSTDLDDDILYGRMNFGCDLSLGYFVANYFAAGLKADIYFHKTKYESGSLVKQNDLLFSPYVRVYAPFGIFLEGSYGLGSAEITTSDPQDGYSAGKNAFNLGIGYSQFIAKSVSLDTYISYNFCNELRKESSTNKNFQGVSILVGLSIFKPLKNNSLTK